MGRLTTRRPVMRIGADGGRTQRPGTLDVEEPLEIRVAGVSSVVTLRTPGHDVELAHGFLLTQGVIGGAGDVRVARYCNSLDAEGRNTYNVLDVDLAPGVPAPAAGLTSSFSTTSFSGVCGKASLEAVRLPTRHSPADDDVRVDPRLFAELPGRLRGVVDGTGELHAAGLFTADGEPITVREDVDGRNAVDKVLGRAVLDDRVPARGAVLVVSGRVSFELAQKAVMAGVPILAAASAPSSLAVDLAADAGLTVVGCVREGLTVYTGLHRVAGPDVQADGAA